jgi:dinuclear metal center YbgI/SA1388 family protein
VLVADIYAHLDERFPFGDAPSWDPVGLQLGDSGSDAGLVGVCHEVTNAVVEHTIVNGIETLVSYHPLLFDPITAVVAGSTPSGRAVRLLRSGVSLVVVHTAMDVAPGGTAEALLAAIGVALSGSFGASEDGSERYIGRFGSLKEATTVALLAETVAERLAAPVQIAGDPDSAALTVAAVPGSGGSFIEEAAEVADVYVTGDVSHHRAQLASERGLVLVDAGHIPTERPGVAHLYDAVRDVVSGAVFIASDPYPWKDVSWKT